MTVHFFLTHGDLTWQYRRALDTARVHGAPVVLWYVGNRPDGDYDMRPIHVEPWLRDASPQVLYDVLALQTLYEHGGMTLGLDSISVRPALNLLPAGKDLVVCSDVPFIDGEYRSALGWPVADPFNNHLIAARRSGVVAAMLGEAKRRLGKGDSRWGATGPLLLTEFVHTYPKRIVVAPFPSLCGWEGSYIWRFYQGEEPGPDVRVIHLYSSAYSTEYASFDWHPSGANGRIRV